MLKLQAAIKYGEEDLVGAKSLVDQSPADDPDSDINRGCLLYKEARYEEALVKFNGAQQVVGYATFTFVSLQSICTASKFGTGRRL